MQTKRQMGQPSNQANRLGLWVCRRQLPSTTTVTIYYCYSAWKLCSFYHPTKGGSLGQPRKACILKWRYIKNSSFPFLSFKCGLYGWIVLTAVVWNAEPLEYPEPFSCWMLYNATKHGFSFLCLIWYDTLFACTQKLTYSQLNLPHGTNKQKSNGIKTKNKNRHAQKKTVQS